MSTVMEEKSNGSRKVRYSSLAGVFKAVVRVSGVLALLIIILGIFYTLQDPKGAMTIVEKLTGITQTPFPTYTSQPTILITQVHEVTREVTSEVTREVTVVVTASLPSYSECGAVIFPLLTEKDIYGQNRPTKLQKEVVRKGPLTLAEVSACFLNDEGKKSDLGDIEEGYENKVVFYDIYGKPHIYRIIVGGRSLPAHASRDNMLFADFGGPTAGFVAYDEFDKGVQNIFKSRGSRQISFQFYVTDNAQGNLSEFYLKIHQNSEIYAQLKEDFVFADR